MLGIDGYRGTRFPEWVGDPSYHNLTELYVFDCRNCCILPPLGQLPFLKKLTMSGMSMLETIGSEFFKNDNSFSETPFPSLECLEFSNMPCWEVWHHPHWSNASFSVLKSLVICGCPKLLGDLPSHLPALDKIQIEECDQFASSLPRASAIRKLKICESNKLVLRELPLSLEALRIQGREVAESVFEAITINLPNSL
ncbi:hypothetical protein P8452_11664 [Trifolium repens]|nr:hypothetical protein P8452_11664 [Trifolium repens]